MMVTLIIERALLERIGGFDPSLIILQDWELAIRLARLGELYSTSEPLVLYRLHASNQSKQIDLHIEPGERVLARLFADPTLPPEIAVRRSYVYAHFYAMLSAAPSRSGVPPTLSTGRAGRSPPIRESSPISPRYLRAGSGSVFRAAAARIVNRRSSNRLMR